jgi:nitrate reductase gamma subunit
MDLLDLARGPILQASIYIFILGSLWRFFGIFFLQRKADLSVPRQKAGLGAGIRMVISRSLTAPAFKESAKLPKVLGYTMHIGLFVVIFLFVPHIVFFKDMLGIGWPGIPNSAIYFIGVVTVATGIVLIIRRMTHPVLRQISNFDDYFSWFVTLLPVLTGLIMPIRFGVRYETLLAIHILSVALLLVWLPFSKLAHAFLVFYSRGTMGVQFERKGAQT